MSIPKRRAESACFPASLSSCLLVVAFAAPSDGGGAAAGAAAPQGRTSRPLVLVTNEPLRAFVERLAGEWLEIELPVPGGVDPAFFEPDDATLLRMQEADLLFENGAGYEHFARKVALPFSRVRVTTRGFEDRLIVRPDAVRHRHGPGGAHSHGGTAFTTWLDFSQAAEQARAVAVALEALLPDRASAIEERLRLLVSELEELDRLLLAVPEQQRRVPVIASHPVYDYLARRLGLDLRSVHWEPDEAPGEAEWEGLRKKLAEHPARIMLWEGEPLPEVRSRLEALGLEIVVFDPCANRPDEGDFFSVLRGDAERLAAALLRSGS